MFFFASVSTMFIMITDLRVFYKKGFGLVVVLLVQASILFYFPSFTQVGQYLLVNIWMCGAGTTWRNSLMMRGRTSWLSAWMPLIMLPELMTMKKRMIRYIIACLNFSSYPYSSVLSGFVVFNEFCTFSNFDVTRIMDLDGYYEILFLF